MEHFESMKSSIIDAMAEYYGEKYRENIEKCIRNIKEYDLENKDESIAEKKEDKINVYFYLGTNDTKKIMNNEEYDSFIYPDRCYYNRLVEIYDISVPVVKEFIAISKRVCDTPQKKLYALVESCIKIFMSQDNGLDKNHVNSRVCFDGEDYYLSSGTVKETFGVNEYKEPVLFENACTKYDAMKITQNILVTNDMDFVFNKDIYFDCVCPLLDNERTREEINFSRINHAKIKDTKDKPLNTVQTIINHNINEVFFDENAKQEKINELLSIINTINIGFPDGEKQK